MEVKSIRSPEEAEKFFGKGAILTNQLISVGTEIKNADHMIERYENLKKHTTDPRLLRHYNFCINKAWIIRARVFSRIII